ncbi:hypothetical protein POF50_032540 [Streptomyces sp. SL13]|uniref:Erythromycin biosynthesis protein CIII-like C-terminal domain-containing protein n=1 Tax=Streptantibioticus silvisoli TaxID=2705255 RepID=A0AA90H5P9_9ACTN|nr:macrolide family glycosyltransferase [Streptantibioticus silvisoli]MDI5967629.1 hypothetical protein [Streptantibioticus silvisoli]MDI5974019.1 hypothetical protein [Streptantibioticus silvisoli]
MAHIAFFTIPAYGHVSCTLEVVAELVRRGHRVTYVTTEEYAATVKTTGAEPLLYPTAWSRETGDGQAQPTPPAAEVVAWAPLVGLAECLAQVEVAKARFDADPPDLVLYDAVNFVVGRGLAKSWGVPAVKACSTLASTGSFSLFNKLTATVEPDPEHFAVKEFTRLTREFLDQHGFPGVQAEELSDRDEELSVVFLPEIFQVASEKFDADRYVFVGPALGNRDFQGSWQPPESGLPVVLVALGTEEPRPPVEFFRSCVETFRDEPWHLVLSTDHVDPADLGPLPPNCEAHRRVPQLKVLRHAAAFVSHGGMGSVMEALSLKVPVVAMPKLPEQAVVSAQIAELGLGVFVSAAGIGSQPSPLAERVEELGIGEFTPFQGEAGTWLLDAVRHVTSDPAVAARLTEMRAAIDSAGGARTAVDAIESRLPVA